MSKETWIFDLVVSTLEGRNRAGIYNSTVLFMFHEENKIFHNSDQAQVFITFFEKVVTKALISNNGKMERIQRITQTDWLKSKIFLL